MAAIFGGGLLGGSVLPASAAPVVLPDYHIRTCTAYMCDECLHYHTCTAYMYGMPVRRTCMIV